tara:strand:- start:2089 stop:2793 length:705 start_codon:yes stop_codon:yes gene_type:complete
MNRTTPTIAALMFLSAAATAGDHCITPNASIPDNASSGITIPINVTASASESVASVDLELLLTHDWIGDLVITLQSPIGTTITLLDRPGIPSAGFPGPFGCGGQDLDATFTDNTLIPAESLCSTTATPVIFGFVIPNMPMDTFTSEPAAGQWMLKVADHSPYDTGAVLQACLHLSTNIDCPADFTGEGNLNFLDVSAFLSAFGNQDPIADFTNDGNFNFLDVSAFLAAFGAGCP